MRSGTYEILMGGAMRHYNRTGLKLGLIIAALMVTACGSNDSTSPQGAPGVVATPQPPTVMTTALYQADANVPLSDDFRLEAKGSPPLTWELAGGALPSGIALQASGALVGVPTQEGQFRFTARVTGPGGSAHREFSLTILGRTHRVSVVSATSTSNPLGEANGPSGEHARSFDPGISGTGRFVVFDSLAGNLVPGINTQGIRQVYLHDRQTGMTELISVDSAGIPGNDASFVAAVTDDGNVVVFDSFASNLVSNDTNSARDVFLRDRKAGTTQRISQFVNGTQGTCTAPNPLDCNSSDPAISADGSIVVFSSFSQLTVEDSDTMHDVFVLDRTGPSPSLKRISRGVNGTPSNGLSGSPAVSADGRFVAFSSEATNLIPGDTSDPYSDIFVFDVHADTLRKASVIAGGVAPDGASFGPSISGDGRFVAFWSEASNLLSDGNGVSDIFVADMQDVPASLKMVVNLQEQQGNGESRFPSISRDGRIIAFDSLATNLDPTPGNGVRDILVLDRSCSSTFNAGLCTLERVSKASNESPSNNESRFPALSGDGRFVVFYSDATNLVTAGDNNGYRDAFVRRR